MVICVKKEEGIYIFLFFFLGWNIGTHENPELIWNDESRSKVQQVVKDLKDKCVHFFFWFEKMRREIVTVAHFFLCFPFQALR